MSSPPVDPWSGQPEHGGPPHYEPPALPPTLPWGHHPGTPEPQPGGVPPAPSAGGWAAPGSQPEQAHHGYAGSSPVPPASGPGYGQPASGVPGYDQPPGYGQPTSGAPGYGQPTSGAPGYGQPASGAPGYGQPTSGAPGYGQPTSGAPGYGPQPAYGPPTPYAPGAEAPQPGKRNQLPLLLSFGLVGLLVLCLGGGGLAYVAFSDEEDPAPSPTAAPSATTNPGPSEPAPTEPDTTEPSPDPQVRLVAPSKLSGRPKTTDPELKAMADQMVEDMKSTVRNQSSAVGAFYGSPKNRNMVMIAGASGFVLNPEGELDDAVDGLSTSLDVRRMSTVAPGPLGGVAKCGDGSASEVPLGVCVWADHGSVGMIVMFFSSASKARSEFILIRSQIEQRY